MKRPVLPYNKRNQWPATAYLNPLRYGTIFRANQRKVFVAFFARRVKPIKTILTEIKIKFRPRATPRFRDGGLTGRYGAHDEKFGVYQVYGDANSPADHHFFNVRLSWGIGGATGRTSAQEPRPAQSHDIKPIFGRSCAHMSFLTTLACALTPRSARGSLQLSARSAMNAREVDDKDAGFVHTLCRYHDFYHHLNHHLEWCRKYVPCNAPNARHVLTSNARWRRRPSPQVSRVLARESVFF